MTQPPADLVRILYAGDEGPQRNAICHALAQAPEVELFEALSPEDFEARLWSGAIDLVVCELAPWGRDPLNVVDHVAHVDPRPVLVLTGEGSEDWAVEAMKRGAVDYLTTKNPRNVENLLQRVFAAARGLSRNLAGAGEQRDLLLSHSMSLLCIVGFDGTMKRWSSIGNRIMGYSDDEILKIKLEELVHPNDLPATAAALGEFRLGHGVYGAEARIRCKDGSYKWILWDAVPCVEQKAFLVAGRDITSRKEIEDELRESQERFQLIASVTKDAVWDWDLRTDRVWRNDGYVKMFGAPPADHATIDWWRQRVHPDDLELVMASIPPPLDAGRQQWLMEYRMRRVDDSYALVYDRGFVIFGRDGQPVRMVGSLLDVSELKIAQEKLRESEERFALAAKATQDAIWDWDLRKAQVWRSENFQVLFGYTADEIEPRFDWWVTRIHPDDQDRVLAEIPSPGAHDSQQCAFEYRFRRADGSYADVVDRGFVMFDAEGKPARMVGSIMDISQRRRAEELVHVQRAELAHIARVSTMGEIATGLAHELNQPLTAIANYAESCARMVASHSPDGDETLLAWIDKIAVNTHRAGEMIRRLRGFTRKSEPRRSTVDVNELVQEVIDLMEAEIRLHDGRVRWEPAEESHATVDRVQIQQVLVNLMRNALEAMSGNGPDDRELSISAAAVDGKIEISVEDTGEGIVAENRDRVFDAFFTSKPSGVGIGLSISRSIVEDHGGRLWVVPNTGPGVTFYFTLPMSGVSHVAVADRVRSG